MNLFQGLTLSLDCCTVCLLAVHPSQDQIVPLDCCTICLLAVHPSQDQIVPSDCCTVCLLAVHPSQDQGYVTSAEPAVITQIQWNKCCLRCYRTLGYNFKFTLLSYTRI